MSDTRLPHDPYNVIITGVGGQGNVLASRVLGSMLVDKGFFVTIGETFGPSQRGGSVMSHLRISKTSVWSPQMPGFRAHIIASLEPIEAIRVLALYGNPEATILCNTRPIYPVPVIRGEEEYPSMETIRKELRSLVPDTLFIDATEEAQKLGSPILANIIMLGAVCGTGVFPVDRHDFRTTISERVKRDQVDINISAFDIGAGLVPA